MCKPHIAKTFAPNLGLIWPPLYNLLTHSHEITSVCASVAITSKALYCAGYLRPEDALVTFSHCSIAVFNGVLILQVNVIDEDALKTRDLFF